MNQYDHLHNTWHALTNNPTCFGRSACPFYLFDLPIKGRRLQELRKYATERLQFDGTKVWLITPTPHQRPTSRTKDTPPQNQQL